MLFYEFPRREMGMKKTLVPWFTPKTGAQLFFSQPKRKTMEKSKEHRKLHLQEISSEMKTVFLFKHADVAACPDLKRVSLGKAREPSQKKAHM